MEKRKFELRYLGTVVVPKADRQKGFMERMQAFAGDLREKYPQTFVGLQIRDGQFLFGRFLCRDSQEALGTAREVQSLLKRLSRKYGDIVVLGAEPARKKLVVI